MEEHTDRIRLLSDTQSFSSLFNFYHDIIHYLSPTIKQEYHLNDSELNEKLDYLSKRHLNIIDCDERLFYNIKRSDYEHLMMTLEQDICVI